jgi:hypothetical protein
MMGHSSLVALFNDVRTSRRFPPSAATPADDWQDDGAYASGAPEHDFAVRRVTLIVLLVAAIVLPCVSVMAYNDLKAREAPRAT